RNETAGQLVGFGGVARQSLSGEDGKNQVRALLTARERTAELLARTGEDLDSHDLSLLEPAMRPVGVFLWGAAFTAETAARWEWGASEAPGKNLVEPGRLEALDVQGLLQLAGVRIADERGQGASLAAGTGVLDLDPLAVRGPLDQERGDLVEGLVEVGGGQAELACRPAVDHAVEVVGVRPELLLPGLADDVQTDPAEAATGNLVVEDAEPAVAQLLLADDRDQSLDDDVLDEGVDLLCHSMPPGCGFSSVTP